MHASRIARTAGAEGIVKELLAAPDPRTLVGYRDRVVPIGTLAVELVTSYLAHVRPTMATRHERALIVARHGGRLGVRGIERIIDRCAKCVGLEGQVTPHVLRHTCATHMLRGGANIRHLQEMLGHATLTSTQVYTRVTVGELKDVHARFHPRGAVDDASVRGSKAVKAGRKRRRSLG